MRKSLFWMAVIGASSLCAAGAAEPPPGPPSDHAATAAAQEKAVQDLAALCARVACRKLPRQVSLRMGDNSSFQIATRMLPYFDDKGTLIIFPGETITLSYAGDDAKLEHPALSSVIDPAGPVELLPPLSGRAVSFRLEQMDGKPDMMLTTTNATKAIVKFDAVMFVPDPASGNARGSRTSTCPILPPQGSAPGFRGFENWPQPVVMLLIGNIRALDAAAPRACN
jgi:hypothetical protein